MLDVHPPHAPAHTWRDFFLHIATITVGLLIAVGIEQAVEAMVHRHERIELIERMHAEAARNLPILQADFANAYTFLSWSQAVLDQLQQTTPVDGRITVILPAAQFGYAREPSRAVWKVARAKGTVALLPENLAEVYDRLDYDAENCDKAQDRMIIVGQREDIVEANLHQSIQPGATLHLSVSQREKLVDAISENQAALRTLAHVTVQWAATSDAILHDVQSRDDILPYLERYEAKIP